MASSLLTDLERYYKLDETSGTTVNDETDNYDATNSVATVNQTGKIDKCYLFDGGLQDTIDISLITPANGSISLWVKFSTLSGLHNIASSGTSALSIMRFGHSTTNPYFGFYDGSAINILDTDTTLAVDTWYHFVATWGADGMKFYINATTPETNAYTGNGAGDQAMYLGNISQYHNGSLDGYVDEIGYWSKQYPISSTYPSKEPL